MSIIASFDSRIFISINIFKSKSFIKCISRLTLIIESFSSNLSTRKIFVLIYSELAYLALSISRIIIDLAVYEIFVSECSLI